MVHFNVPGAWSITTCPDLEDIVYDNLWRPYHERSVRSWLIGAATVTLVLFYIIPVAFVASLTSLQALSDTIPFLASVVDISPILRGFLEGFLPTLALLIFMAILPSLMMFFSKTEGIPTITGCTVSAITKMYLFQLVNVFFVSIIAGSAFNAISDIISSPSSILSLLGEAIPKTGLFFTNYVMLLGELS